MTIENTLERIATALEKIADNTGVHAASPVAEVIAPPAPVEKPAAVKKAKPSPVVEAPADPDPFQEEPQTQYTQADLRAALQAYAKAASQAEALALMAKHGGGAQSLPALKPEYYAPLMAALKKASK